MNDVDLSKFTDSQVKYIEARLVCRSDKEAADMIGISPNTVYNWPEKNEINVIVQQLKLSDLRTTRERMYRLLPKALDVIDEELDDSEKNRAYIVFNLLDRIGISAKQQIDVTSGGQPITLTAEERELRLKALLNKDA